MDVNVRIDQNVNNVLKSTTLIELMVINMDKVECTNCGNEIIFDYIVLCKFFSNIHKDITTNAKMDKMTSLEYFDITVKCCDEPDYDHIEL